MKTKALVLRRDGMERPYDSTSPLSLEILDLTGPGEGQVLVEVAAAGLCHSDLSVVDGNRPRPTPMVLGHEGSGVVRECGPGVRSVRPGDNVVFTFVPTCGQCEPCHRGRPALCLEGNRANREGCLLDGTRPFRDEGGEALHQHLGVSAFSEHTVVREESVVRLPEGVDLRTGALFSCAVMTGVGAALNTAAVRAGETVAVFGLGGVGLSALMGARVAGASRIIAVDLQPGKLELARELGADEAVEATREDLVTAIRELTGGGVDVAIEAVGSVKVLESAYAAAGSGGRVVTTGLPHPDSRLSLPGVSLVGEEKTLMGSYMGSCVPARDIPRFVELHRSGRLPVDRMVSGTCGLADMNQALENLAEGTVVRQVLEPAGGELGCAAAHAGAHADLGVNAAIS